MPGFSNGIMYANNVDFSGNPNPGPELNLSGQIIIARTGLNPAIKRLSPDFDYSGASDIKLTPGDHVIYVSGTGSILNSGAQITQPLPTFTDAIAAAVAAVPSAINRFCIVCLEDSIFTENITCVPFVDIFAPNATLTGTIILDDDVNVKFFALNVADGAIGVLKNAGTDYANVEIDVVTCLLSGVGFVTINGLLNCKWKQLFVVDGFGVGDITSNTAHMHVQGGDIYISGTGTAIARAFTGSTVGHIDHILDIGAGVGTAINVTDGTMDITVNKIANNAAYTVSGATSVLRLFANEIAGTRTVALGGVAKVWVPPTEMLNGQIIIGSTGLDPVVTSITPGPNISITPGAGSLTIGATGAEALTWSEVTGTIKNATVNNGYITNNANRVGVELPSIATQGSLIALAGKGSGGWTLAPNVGQTIYNATTSISYPQVMQSANAHNCVEVVNITANTEFDVRNSNGTINNVILDAALGTNLFYLKNNGSVWGCGDNSNGTLGNNTRTNASSPIAMVGSHSFVAITTSSFSFYGLKTDGSIWCCGANAVGQLGQQNLTSFSSPVAVVGNHSFVQFATGNQQSILALKSDGSTWGIGLNDQGQLGDLSKTNRSSPVQVAGNHSFIQIAHGTRVGMGLKADGSAWTWGVNNLGQLGNNTTTPTSSPVAVTGAHSFIQISAGCDNNGQVSAGLKADGQVWVWGGNISGGMGNLTNSSFSSPVQIVGNHSFISLVGTFDGFFALKADGSCWAWGIGLNGRLGNQTTSNVSSPIQVVGNSFYTLARTPRKNSSHSSFVGMGLKADGSAWTWGLNSSGQLGDQSLTDRSSPIQVVGVP